MREQYLSGICLLRSSSFIKRKWVTGFLLVVVISLAPSLQAQLPSDRYQRELQPIIEKFIQDQQVPGLAIAIVEDNKIVYAHAFGVKSLSKKADPMTTESLFHMASITKPFVATSVMQLVEQGKMDLDAPVNKYLPYFCLADVRYAKLTIRQLITHTSGMPDVQDYEWNKPQYDDGALERYVRSLGDANLLFSPGEQVRYSNMAFEVLGDVIAKVSGESFEDYVQHHILTPVGMVNSTLLLKHADPKLLTWGHELDPTGNPEPSRVFPYNRTHSPSSNLHSNVLDMSRWAMVNMNLGELDGKRILNTSTYKIMWNPVGRRTEEVEVGISWFLTKYRGHSVVFHAGDDAGYVTDFAMLVQDRIAVVWMTNCDWVGTTLTKAAFDVALGFRPDPIIMRRSIASAMYATLKVKGMDSRGAKASIAEYEFLKKTQPDLYTFSDDELISLASDMLGGKHVTAAIRLLEFTVKEFPSSAKAYDSLGEAYSAAGKYVSAIANYQKALNFDPNLSHARDQLTTLKARRRR